MEILFEDNHLLVVNKPAGILTQPDDTGRENLEDLAKAYIKRPYLHALHRLDRPVSGIVVFAKTSKALSRLNKSMREGKFKKLYHAKVDRNPKKDADELIDTLDDKNCRLRYRRVGDCLLEVELITGRKHQIRKQLSGIGCPIVGDEKYGSRTKSDAIGLTHVKISFPHPITGEEVTYSLSGS